MVIRGLDSRASLQPSRTVCRAPDRNSRPKVALRRTGPATGSLSTVPFLPSSRATTSLTPPPPTESSGNTGAELRVLQLMHTRQQLSGAELDRYALLSGRPAAARDQRDRAGKAPRIRQRPGELRALARSGGARPASHRGARQRPGRPSLDPSLHEPHRPLFRIHRRSRQGGFQQHPGRHDHRLAHRKAYRSR